MEKTKHLRTSPSGHFIDEKNNWSKQSAKKMIVSCSRTINTVNSSVRWICVILVFLCASTDEFHFLTEDLIKLFLSMNSQTMYKTMKTERKGNRLILRKHSDLCSAYADWKVEKLNFRCWQETPSLRWNAKHSLMVGWGAQRGFRKVSVFYSFGHTQKTHHDTSQEGKSLRHF